jgi:hypothetical protein
LDNTKEVEKLGEGNMTEIKVEKESNSGPVPTSSLGLEHAFDQE